MYNNIGLATNPEPPYEPFIRCQKCGNEMYGGEEAFSLDLKSRLWVCDQCFDEFWEQMTRREKADLIGAEVRLISFARHIRPVDW